MAKAYKKRSLGRGLSSILNDDENNILDQKKNKLFNEIQIDLIDLNPFQPRTNFNSNELEQLTDSLNSSLRRLRSGGRLATIAYHSLEDRIVKKKMANLIRDCNCPPQLPKCMCSGIAEFIKVGRGRFYPSEEEVARNSRARSATLRIYEKRESTI